MAAPRMTRQRVSDVTRVGQVFVQGAPQRGSSHQTMGNLNYSPRVIFLESPPPIILKQELDIGRVNFAESILWKFDFRIGKPFLWEREY